MIRWWMAASLMFPDQISMLELCALPTSISIMIYKISAAFLLKLFPPLYSSLRALLSSCLHHCADLWENYCGLPLCCLDLQTICLRWLLFSVDILYACLMEQTLLLKLDFDSNSYIQAESWQQQKFHAWYVYKLFLLSYTQMCIVQRLLSLWIAI